MMSPSDIDLNCDLGEGYANDSTLMPLITSANLACGFHAGDPRIMRTTLEMAAQHGVRIGAHPGYPDRLHFGRHPLVRTPLELKEELSYQIGALMGLAQLTRTRVSYLKPHGALYGQACQEVGYATAVVEVARLFNLGLVGLPGSQLQAQSEIQGCPFFPEGFADRRYQPDGMLVPRSEPNALVEDPDEVLSALPRLLARGIRTLCVHGDHPQAVSFLGSLRDALRNAGYQLQAFS